MIPEMTMVRCVVERCDFGIVANLYEFMRPSFLAGRCGARKKKSSIRITWLSVTFNAVIARDRLMRAHGEEKSRCSRDSTANFVANSFSLVQLWTSPSVLLANSRNCQRATEYHRSLGVLSTEIRWTNVLPRASSSRRAAPRGVTTNRTNAEGTRLPQLHFRGAKRHIWPLNPLLSQIFIWIVTLNAPKFDCQSEYHLILRSVFYFCIRLH